MLIRSSHHLFNLSIYLPLFDKWRKVTTVGVLHDDVDVGVRPGEVQHLDDELVLQLLQRSNSGVYKVPYYSFGGRGKYIKSVKSGGKEFQGFWEEYI